MISLAQGLFMAEAEGLLDTKESRLNAAIKDLKNNPDKDYIEILTNNALDPDDLTFREHLRVLSYKSY